MKFIIRFFVFTNLFISLCSASLTIFCHLIIADEFPSKTLTSFVFFSTLFAYNFHRKVGSRSVSVLISNREEWFRSYSKLIYCIIFLSFALSAYYYYDLPKLVSILIFPLGIISIFYVLQINKLPSLRSIPFLKIFIISFVWGGVAVLLPILSNKLNSLILTWNTHMLAISISMYVFAETLPFDIRDMEEDKKVGLKTIPQKIGITKAKRLSISMYVLSFLIVFVLSCFRQIQWIYTLSILLSILYSLFFILGISSKRGELYYSFGLETSLLAPLFFYLTLKHVF